MKGFKYHSNYDPREIPRAKTCKECGIFKLLKEFPTQMSNRDCHANVCIVCKRNGGKKNE